MKILCDRSQYAIIQFDEDDTIEVVPLNWIADGICYWPNLRLGMWAFNQSVKNCVEADLEKWTKYPCRVKKVFGKQTSK